MNSRPTQQTEVVAVVADERRIEVTDRRLALGFRDQPGSVLHCRTIMAAELAAVLERTQLGDQRLDYKRAMVELNGLAKASASNRTKTASLLSRLYGFDEREPIFRALRRWWLSAGEARPLLAMLAASARDRTVRQSWAVIAEAPIGAVVARDTWLEFANRTMPQLSEASALALAQRLASSWTQSGHLSGKVHKSRRAAPQSLVATAFALLLGYLQGVRGERLFATLWAARLDLPHDQLLHLAAAASRAGLLRLLQSGGVVEIRFPDLLTAGEEERCSEPS